MRKVDSKEPPCSFNERSRPICSTSLSIVEDTRTWFKPKLSGCTAGKIEQRHGTLSAESLRTQCQRTHTYSKPQVYQELGLQSPPASGGVCLWREVCQQNSSTENNQGSQPSPTLCDTSAATRRFETPLSSSITTG